MKTAFTISMVLLLFCASMAESSVCYLCSLITCPSECTTDEESECFAEPELQSCCVCPNIQPEDAIPIDLDDDCPVWICCIFISTDLTISPLCDSFWYPPVLTFLVGDRPVLSKDQSVNLENENAFSDSGHETGYSLSSSCPVGIHHTIPSTVLRC